MANQVLLTTTGTPATVTINDLGAIVFVHPVVDEALVSPDGFLDYETVLESLESGDLGAAVTAGEITLSDASGNDLQPGSDALTFVSLTATETIQGTKTFNSDRIFIDPTDTGTSTTMEIGWFNDLLPADPNSFGFRRTDGGGVFSWANNANFPQIFSGSPTGTGETFIDATNNRPLNLNVLDTGVDDPGEVTIGIGGLIVEGSSEVVPTSPLTVFRDDTTPILSFQVEPDGTLTVGTTTAYETLVTADNDIPNKKYVDDAIAASGGGGGGTGFIEYKFDNSTSMSNPGNGEFRYNNSTPASVTAIAISDESEEGGDISTLIGFLSPGNVIYIQEIEDGGAFAIFNVVSTVDNGSWWQINVTVIDSGTLPDDGKECGVNFVYGGGATAEVNDLTAAVTWANVPDANITQSSVTQHEAAIDHDALTNFVANEHIDWTVDQGGTYVNINNIVDTTVPLTNGDLFTWNGTNIIPADDGINNQIRLLQAGCVAEFVDTSGLDFCNSQIGPTSGSAFYIAKRGLGTIAAPTAVTGGTKIGGYSFLAVDGVTSNPGYVSVEINSFAQGDQNGTNGGANLNFLVTTQGTKTAFTALEIEDDGTLSVAGQTDYETKVTADDDIPNKIYVDQRAPYSIIRVSDNGGSDLTANYNVNGAEVALVLSGPAINVGSASTDFTNALGSITCNFDGVVRATGGIPIISTGARNSNKSIFQVNGTNYGSPDYTYIRNSTGHQRDANNISEIIQVSNGDVIRIGERRTEGSTNGSATNILAGANITIERLQ